MKTVSVTQNFKTVSESLAKKVPALADRVGQKRSELKFEFQGFESIEDISSVPVEQVCYFVNMGIELFARKQVQEHAINWDFVPQSADLTLDAAFKDATSSISRARTLTKETAAEFAKFYVMFGNKLLSDLTEKAAQAGAQVIREFLVYSKQESYCRNLSVRLTSLAEAILSQDEDSEVMNYIAEIAESGIDLFEVMNALIEKFNPENIVVVTADAL